MIVSFLIILEQMWKYKICSAWKKASNEYKLIDLLCLKILLVGTIFALEMVEKYD